MSLLFYGENNAKLTHKHIEDRAITNRIQIWIARLLR